MKTIAIALLSLFAITANAQDWSRPGLAYNETGGYVAFMAPYGVTEITRMFPGSEYRLLYQKPQSEITVHGADYDSVYNGSYEYSCDGDIWWLGPPMVFTSISWETSWHMFESKVICDATTKVYLRTQTTARVWTATGDATGPGDGVKPLAGHIQPDEYGSNSIPLYLAFRFRSQGHDWNPGYTVTYQAKAPGEGWTNLDYNGGRGYYRPQVLGTHKLRVKVKSALKSCLSKTGKARRCVKNGPVFRLTAE